MACLEDTLLDQAVPPVGRSILADLEFLYASKRGEAWWVRSDIVWCLSGGAWLYAKTQKGVMPSMLKDLVRLDRVRSNSGTGNAGHKSWLGAGLTPLAATSWR